MRQPVAEAGRLDAEAGDRASQRDRAQLGTTSGISPCAQRRGDEVLVGAHALHVGGAGDRVHRQHAVEAGDVQTGHAERGPRPEQVRGALGQPHRRPGRDRGVRRLQALHRGGVPLQISLTHTTKRTPARPVAARVLDAGPRTTRRPPHPLPSTHHGPLSPLRRQLRPADPVVHGHPAVRRAGRLGGVHLGQHPVQLGARAAGEGLLGRDRVVAEVAGLDGEPDRLARPARRRRAPWPPRAVMLSGPVATVR